MSVVYDCANKTPLAEGGEGVIYEYNGQVIKVYKPGANLQSKQNKVQWLIRKSLSGLLPQEVVCPRDIVVDKGGVFIGFSMDKVEGEEVKKLANRKFLTANNITTKDIISMLVKIQEVLSRLHDNHIFIGDLNDQNILFDEQFRVYFIDCDSWTVENEKCEVAMDLFKDPLLRSNDFDAGTDTYSFAILIWKLLTRIHPFGGTMDPDMNIMERMRNGISVIDNPQVTIPRTIKSWRNLSPSLIGALQRIFRNQSRELYDELSELLGSLKYCNVDQEYYYGKYGTCPLCDRNARIKTKPLSQGVVDGLKLSALFSAKDIKTVFNETIYLDQKDEIVELRQGRRVKYQYGVRYYFTSDGYLIEDLSGEFVIHSGKEYRIQKKYKSRIVVEGSHVYYISKQNSFTDMTVLKIGNSIRSVCKCSNTSYFEVSDGSYCVLNYYCGKLILTMNGTNMEIEYDTDIIYYGIHYDDIVSKWLILLEDSAGTDRTYVVSGRGIEYETDQISYQCPLSAPCISNSTLYIPIDGKIRGFSYIKSVYKDFACDVVNSDSTLLKRKNQFVIVNDENVYRLG
ncbi:MAG: hypothetical protein K2N44_13895 [Lachnospiraceae bacterium]|nr:hypothetical protein [Lachnospiraceae bacterium]